jgi:hypothetical protein
VDQPIVPAVKPIPRYEAADIRAILYVPADPPVSLPLAIGFEDGVSGYGVLCRPIQDDAGALRGLIFACPDCGFPVQLAHSTEVSRRGAVTVWGCVACPAGHHFHILDGLARQVA